MTTKQIVKYPPDDTFYECWPWLVHIMDFGLFSFFDFCIQYQTNEIIQIKKKEKNGKKKEK